MNTELHLLVSFLVVGEISLRTTDLNMRGVPIHARPDRTPALVARSLTQMSEPWKEGPLAGFVVTGSNKSGGYLLKDPQGRHAADIKANGVFECKWIHGYANTLQNIPNFDFETWSKAAAHWLHCYVADLRDTYDKPTVRRIWLAWLRHIGCQDTGIPGLYWAPLSLRDEVEKVIAALEEAEWTTWLAREYSGGGG